MTNKERYEREINTNDDYKVTIKEFESWLKEVTKEESFKKEITKEDIYDTACDYSIPIVMIKYFKKMWF